MENIITDPTFFDDESLFFSYTSRWKMRVNAVNSPDEPPIDLQPFFRFAAVPNKPLNTLNMYFTDDNITSLISTIGIAEVRVRFALIDAPNLGLGSRMFTLILYGTDSLGSRCSSYYIGQPQNLQLVGDATNDGNISDPLAIDWITNWVNLNQGQQPFSSEIFNTRYGYLNGLTYKMSDFMNSLFPPGMNVMSKELYVMLALHKHHSSDGSQSSDYVYTFGLVIAGTLNKTTTVSITLDAGATVSVPADNPQLELKNLTDGELQVAVVINKEVNQKKKKILRLLGDDDTYVFYDLSAPSPPAP